MTPSLDLWLLVSYLVFVQPLLGWWRMRRLRRFPGALTSTRKFVVYLWILGSQWALVAIAAWILARHGESLLDLGLRGIGTPWLTGSMLAAAAAVAVATARSVRALASHPERKLPPHLRGIVRILPSTPLERMAFVGVALTAGICEEILYRGFLIGALAVLVGPGRAALVLSSVAFGVAHSYQGPRGVLITGVLGALLGTAYVLGGSLWPCIAFHAALDLASGFALGAHRWQDRPADSDIEKGTMEKPMTTAMATEKATFAAGCFWGVEAAFRQIEGVRSTAVGYTGGRFDRPTYEDVCSDRTGHAEAVEVEFDPARVSYDELLRVFWGSHDPTQKNRQGPDMGSQYRSAIYFHSPEQEAGARASQQELERSGAHGKPIVTEIVPASTFWRAEDYHQQYLEKRGLAHCNIPRS